MESMTFYLDDISDSEYDEYIYELLMLLDMLCTNNDRVAIDFVKKELNLKPHILLKLATNRNIHMLYRIAGHHLFMTTFVCAMEDSTSLIINHFDDMCFKATELKDPEI